MKFNQMTKILPQNKALFVPYKKKKTPNFSPSFSRLSLYMCYLYLLYPHLKSSLQISIFFQELQTAKKPQTLVTMILRFKQQCFSMIAAVFTIAVLNENLESHQYNNLPSVNRLLSPYSLSVHGRMHNIDPSQLLSKAYKRWVLFHFMGGGCVTWTLQLDFLD